MRLITALTLITASLDIIHAADRCANSNLFLCPNCGGSLVSDCLECDGYLNTDRNNGICFSRKLFGRHEHLDHDNHYPLLWNDILGTIIWFLAAGIATACGVGGGGIYVPLGIILLRFSSKPSSGLSQASIFGASLGGLILNIRNKHPDEKVRDTMGKRDKDFKIVPYEKNMNKTEQDEDEKIYLSANEHIRRNGSSSDLKKKKEKRKYDRTQDDALVVVASCFVPRGYLRYEHELSNSFHKNGKGHGHGSNQQQGGHDHQNTLEAFNIFRTLLPDENPLQVKNEMWMKAQQVQEEAHTLFGDLDDFSIATAANAGAGASRKDSRGRQKAPIIRLFFVPRHDNGVASNATIEIEGYCTDADSDDEEDYSNDSDTIKQQADQYDSSGEDKDGQEQVQDENMSVKIKIPQWKRAKNGNK